ncbi:MAG TPA: universal stress protein [Sporichthyaceae bacterium]|jgi:nucleotide-binding universal stress UspA family protein|nr:universal stress protein [Sporichthyaceae bacterium]
MSGKDEMSSVLVGFDGTDLARAALVVAAGEANLRGLRLRILHAVEAVEGAGESGTPAGVVEAELAEKAAALARSVLPAGRVDVETVHGWAVDELLARSAGAQMLVLGRGHPGVLGALLGSVALGAATGASCPVLVVPDPGPGGPRSEGIVVVGVHGVEDSTDALQEAFTEADLRRAQLVAVHTSRFAAWAGAPEPAGLSRDPLGLERDEAAVLRDALLPFRAKFPGVGVTEQLGEGNPAQILVEISAQAQMLVVGTRGRGPVEGLVLGSVGQHLIRHANCPVLVARPHVDGG